MSSEAKGFTILFTARSGSNFIVFTLRKHPQIMCRADVFGNKVLPGGLEQTADNQIAFMRRYWRSYRRDAPIPTDVARGFKVQILRAEPQLKALGRFIKVCGDYDVARFFLYRRNRVKQIVSVLRARELKRASAGPGGVETAHGQDDRLAGEVARLPKMQLNPIQLQVMLETLEQNYRLLDNIRSKTPGAIELVYEDVLNERQAFFDRIFAAIGVAPIDVTDDDATKKINSDNLQDVILNYDEVRDYFSGTEYAPQLAE